MIIYKINNWQESFPINHERGGYRDHFSLNPLLPVFLYQGMQEKINKVWGCRYVPVFKSSSFTYRADYVWISDSYLQFLLKNGLALKIMRLRDKAKLFLKILEKPTNGI